MSRILLDKLLWDNLTRYQPLYYWHSFHNHNAHHLSSLHYLGASDDQMSKAYENMCQELDPYEPSSEKVDQFNWRTFLGNRHFCQSYRDFFQQQLKSSGDDWKKTLLNYLLDNPKQPLINSLISGLAHPLIHVGYAFETDSLPIGIEALTMTAVCYNYLHEFIDELQTPSSPSKSAMEIIKSVRCDARLPIYPKPGISHLEEIVRNCHDTILSYYNQWKIGDDHFETTVEELFDLAVYIYGATHRSDLIVFDFFLLHLLTSMHAIRILQSVIKDPTLFQHILCQFFYFAIVIYISQLRPEVNEQLIDNYEIPSNEKNWNYVIDRLLNTTMINNAHAVKVIRVLRDAEQVYGYKNGLYLKTAVKTVDNLDLNDLWVGGTNDERQINVLKQS